MITLILCCKQINMCFNLSNLSIFEITCLVEKTILALTCNVFLQPNKLIHSVTKWAAWSTHIICSLNPPIHSSSANYFCTTFNLIPYYQWPNIDLLPPNSKVSDRNIIMLFNNWLPHSIDSIFWLDTETAITQFLLTDCLFLSLWSMFSSLSYSTTFSWSCQNLQSHYPDIPWLAVALFFLHDLCGAPTQSFVDSK